MPNEDVGEVLGRYEMSRYPPALFDDAGLPLSPKKAELAQYLLRENYGAAPPSNAASVLDGGLILHHAKWESGVTYREVINMYLSVIQRYHDPVVVFDGYSSSPGTKDPARMKRSVCKFPCATFRCTEDTLTSIPCEQFLRNSENKAQLIGMLTQRLNENGIHTEQAVEDADVTIAKTAYQ